MRTRSHHKQVLLFLVAVVLPSTVLVVLTWHMIGQQQELSEKRMADERRRMATEIGQKLLVRLEEIKLHEVSATASGAKPPNTIDYTSDEIILTALATGERLSSPLDHNQLPDPVLDVVRHLDNRINALTKLMLEKQCFSEEEFKRQHMQEEEEFIETFLEQEPQADSRPK